MEFINQLHDEARCFAHRGLDRCTKAELTLVNTFRFAANDANNRWEVRDRSQQGERTDRRRVVRVGELGSRSSEC